MLAATVVVPTHDHGPTLLRSIPSALAQTVTDLEVLVVGDGAPDVTREITAELTSADPRVRYFDNPKGPRNGELHRHEALREARGEIVCYLSDDDLWLPNHVEQLQALLADNDFAHTLPLSIDPRGQIHHWRVDLALPFYRQLLLVGENRVPLACGGHTLDLYRRLPAGWRTAPPDLPSDLYMWQQMLSFPGCRAASGTHPTVLHFPSPDRLGWSTEERLAELDAWARQAAEPAWRSDLAQHVLDAVLADDSGLDEERAAWEDHLAAERAARDDHLAALHEQVVSSQDYVVSLQEHVLALEDDQALLRDEQARLIALIAEREQQLTMFSSSITWRLRERLVSLPVLSGPLRWAARALARPGARAETGSAHLDPKPEENPSARESRAPDLPNDSPARHSDPSTR